MFPHIEALDVNILFLQLVDLLSLSNFVNFNFFDRVNIEET